MRILLVGCGRWGRNILRDLLALRCAVTVVDPSAAAREHACALGATRTIAAMDDAHVDGVVIATPTATHAEVLVRFLLDRTPVLIEKPLCDDPVVARRILAEARGRIQVSAKWRYHPAVGRLAAIARSGELGAVVGLRTRRLQPDHDHGDTDPIWTLAPHDLDIAREILGRVPPLRHACREGDPPRGVHALFGDGVGGGPWFALETSASRPRTEREVALVCAGGTAWLDDPAADEIHVRAHPGHSVVSERVPGEAPLLALLRAFVAHLAGGAPLKGTLADAVETVEIIAALHGQRVISSDGIGAVP